MVNNLQPLDFICIQEAPVLVFSFLYFSYFRAKADVTLGHNVPLDSILVKKWHMAQDALTVWVCRALCCCTAGNTTRLEEEYIFSRRCWHESWRIQRPHFFFESSRFQLLSCDGLDRFEPDQTFVSHLICSQHLCFSFFQCSQVQVAVLNKSLCPMWRHSVCVYLLCCRSDAQRAVYMVQYPVSGRRLQASLCGVHAFQ